MADGATPMSDEEFRTMVKLLHRYAETELDQWEAWRLPTTYGDVFINVRKSLALGDTLESYDNLASWVGED